MMCLRLTDSPSLPCRTLSTEDLQKLYKRSGVKGEGIMFLFTDSQIIDEKMLVYINDLLASGEIPDLFPIEVRAWMTRVVHGAWCLARFFLDESSRERESSPLP
jgi:hypothetical protein